MLKFGIDLLSGHPTLSENQHKICSHSGYEPDGPPTSHHWLIHVPNYHRMKNKQTKIEVKCDSWIKGC